MTPRCLEAITALYSEGDGTAGARLVDRCRRDGQAAGEYLPAPSTLAWSVKFAIMCQKLGLDTWGGHRRPATKPFGFMPFYPGPGLGGTLHPVDPLYLSWKLRTLKCRRALSTWPDQINAGVPEVVVGRVRMRSTIWAGPLRGSQI
jgi:hypothetical protein